MYLWVREEGEEMLFVKNKETRGRKLVVDDVLKACGRCGQVWEKVNKRVHAVDHVIYPFGVIPRYGKEKKTCPRCKNMRR